MPEAVVHNAERIKSYEDAIGFLEVEDLLDATLALEQHVDPFLLDRPSREDELKSWRDQAIHAEVGTQRLASEFDDLFEPRNGSVQQNIGKRALAMMPPSPDLDVLGFIRNHAPYLEEWQRDVVDIVRSESLYFYPQRRTKIMNEGWAAYWHKRIMREMGDRNLITDEENEVWWKLHSGVVAPNPRSLNPYYLGMKMYEYLEEYRNGTLTDDETAWLKKEGIPTYPRYEGPLKDSPATEYLRDIMMHNDDQSFLRNYFNKIVSDRMDMYIYETHQPHPLYPPVTIIMQDGWRAIREKLVSSMDNSGIPYITVKDGDYNKSGELYLQHQFDGRSLDPEYIEKTLPYVFKLWQRTVHIETVEAKTNKTLTYSFDGSDLKKDTKA